MTGLEFLLVSLFGATLSGSIAFCLFNDSYSSLRE